MDREPPGASPAPSRELTELLLSLSAAVQQHGMYPAGHPALERASVALNRQAARVLDNRPDIGIGVARRQLLIDGHPTDPANAMFRRLAESLHGHHLAAVTLHRGVTPAELAEALRWLSADPKGGALGLLPAGDRPAWAHVQIEPVNFDQLALVDGAEGAEPAAGTGTARQLWIALAQAALAGTTGAAADDVTPEAIAQALNARFGRGRESAGGTGTGGGSEGGSGDRGDRTGTGDGNGDEPDEAAVETIVSSLRQITEALSRETGLEGERLRTRTSQLVSTLAPGTLGHLMAAGQHRGASARFVADAVRGLHVGAVLDILKAAADTSGETISHGLLRMLTKLTAQAEQGPPAARARADHDLRTQVSQLLTDWTFEDPNPEQYGRLLHELSSSPRTPETAGDGAARELDPSVRLIQMSLEVGDFGPLADRAVTRLIDRGDVASLVTLLETAPATPATEALRGRLQAPDALTRLLRHEPVDFATLDRLLPSMTASAVEPIFDVLADADNRTTRRRLLDRLAETPLDISTAIVGRLEDPRWHVQRNMLWLLERRRRVPEGFSTTAWLSHDDRRVRYEAVRLGLSRPEDRASALRVALHDNYPRIVGLALAALAALPGDLAGDALRRVTAIAQDASLPDEVRLQSIAALDRSAQPAAVAALTRLVDGGRSFFGRRRLAATSPTMLAALRSLAAHQPGDAVAQRLLTLARSSAHADVRQAAGGSS